MVGHPPKRVTENLVRIGSDAAGGVGEDRRQADAEDGDGANDHNGDEHYHQRVLDCGSAAFWVAFTKADDTTSDELAEHVIPLCPWLP